jgi:hypothetical protein
MDVRIEDIQTRLEIGDGEITVYPPRAELLLVEIVCGQRDLVGKVIAARKTRLRGITAVTNTNELIQRYSGRFALMYMISERPNTVIARLCSAEYRLNRYLDTPRRINGKLVYPPQADANRLGDEHEYCLFKAYKQAAKDEKKFGPPPAVDAYDRRIYKTYDIELVGAELTSQDTLYHIRRKDGGKLYSSDWLNLQPVLRFADEFPTSLPEEGADIYQITQQE